jgi:hypothetical protein
MQQIADWRRRDPRVRDIDIREVRRDDPGTHEQRTLRLRASRAHRQIGERDADE